MQRYYADYGMASYQTLRAKFESWYIPNYHTEDDPSFLAHIKAKEAELMRFMNGKVDFSSVGSVLDFGGAGIPFRQCSATRGAMFTTWRR